MDLLKKNLSVILVILLTLLLIAMVIWVFDKKIESLDKKNSVQTVITENPKHHNHKPYHEFTTSKTKFYELTITRC